jgi:hypothetical protein
MMLEIWHNHDALNAWDTDMKIAGTELKLTLPVKKNAAFKRLVA